MVRMWQGEDEKMLLWCNFREMEQVKVTGALSPYSDLSKEGMGVPNTHSHFLLLTLNRGPLQGGTVSRLQDNAVSTLTKEGH